MVWRMPTSGTSHHQYMVVNQALRCSGSQKQPPLLQIGAIRLRKPSLQLVIFSDIGRQLNSRVQEAFVTTIHSIAWNFLPCSSRCYTHDSHVGLHSPGAMHIALPIGRHQMFHPHPILLPTRAVHHRLSCAPSDVHVRHSFAWAALWRYQL